MNVVNADGNTGEREAQQAWQSGENALTLDEKKRQFDLSFGQSNDQYDKSLAVSWVQSLLANGQMPTDDLLAQAGLSKENAEKMIAKNTGSGYSGSTKKSPLISAGGNPTTPANATGDMISQYLSGGSIGNTGKSTGSLLSIGAQAAAGATQRTDEKKNKPD